MTPEYDTINAWLFDAGARKDMDADVALELGVRPAYVSAAYHRLTMPRITDAPRLQDYIAAARVALVEAVKDKQTEDDARERAYQARRREELKAKRAAPRAPPTRAQPYRRAQRAASC
jgi:hypothetical protein